MDNFNEASTKKGPTESYSAGPQCAKETSAIKEGDRVDYCVIITS